MIVGTGLDLIAIDRIRRFRARRGDRGLRRLFTAAELEYCMSRPEPDPSFAVRFAAKEAFFKAVGTGYGIGGDWTEVEVCRDQRGAPSITLSGRAAETARQARVRTIFVSLSHADETAGAVVVLQG